MAARSQECPQDAATSALVKRLRNTILPPVERTAGVDVKITGTVAVNVDFSAYIASRLPYFFGAVLALSFLLLMVVFRSLLVPLKAVVMNLLSVGTAYGVVVALFQWGWLGDVINVQPAPIEPCRDRDHGGRIRQLPVRARPLRTSTSRAAPNVTQSGDISEHDAVPLPAD